MKKGYYDVRLNASSISFIIKIRVSKNANMRQICQFYTKIAKSSKLIAVEVAKGQTKNPALLDGKQGLLLVGRVRMAAALLRTLRAQLRGQDLNTLRALRL